MSEHFTKLWGKSENQEGMVQYAGINNVEILIPLSLNGHRSGYQICRQLWLSERGHWIGAMAFSRRTQPLLKAWSGRRE